MELQGTDGYLKVLQPRWHAPEARRLGIACLHGHKVSIQYKLLLTNKL